MGGSFLLARQRNQRDACHSISIPTKPSPTTRTSDKPEKQRREWVSVGHDNPNTVQTDRVTEPVTKPDDLSWGAFSDSAPWIVDRSALAWANDAVILRREARSEVPRLTQPGKLPPVGRLLRVVSVLGWAVVPWLVRKKLRRFATPEAARADISLRLRRAVETLGPTYIKLGQIISSGEGLFPSELVDEFKRCRDQVPAESFDVVQMTIEQDLGARLNDVFLHIDRTPLAAASIAQVHAATLVTGEPVVVKVQRPNIGTLVRKDLRVMSWLAPFLIGRIPIAALANPPALVELFAETIVEELDFRMEASNMVDVSAMLRSLNQEWYVVPRPHPSLVTRRILVMERLKGFNFDDVEGMKAAGIDTENIIRTGMIAFMEGAMIEGIFHGDLHGGNLFVMSDGRTALLDFGIVGRLSQPRRIAFLRLMLGATTNDLKGQVEALRDLGALPTDIDVQQVIKDLRLDQPTIDPTTLSGEELVKEVQRIVKALLGYGASMPKELMLYVKNMVFLDGAIARLAPDLDILQEVASISMIFAERHGERIGRELGFNPDSFEVNLDSVKASLGVDSSVNRLTYRELQQRRDLINKRMRDHIKR
jgi:ubiquinone biosynthesis protein